MIEEGRGMTAEREEDFVEHFGRVGREGSVMDCLSRFELVAVCFFDVVTGFGITRHGHTDHLQLECLLVGRSGSGLTTTRNGTSDQRCSLLSGYHCRVIYYVHLFMIFMKPARGPYQSRYHGRRIDRMC